MDMSNDQLFHSLPPRPMTTTDRRWRGNICPAPNCPRCASSNTKFCYYNNYSLSQPRFFCKGCRRYWTKGGSLRNVPVGGGCRKSRRSRAARGFSSTISGAHSDINSSPNSSTGSELGCPDIDMAAVFAKFLNPRQEKVSDELNEATTNTSSEASYDSPISCSYGLENGLEYQKLSDDLLDNLVPSDHNQLQVEEVNQGFIHPDLTTFEDVIDDDFWLGDSNLSGLMTWQPVAQMQEFNSSLPPAEQSKNSTNLFTSDNWSYFDSTELEVFSGL